MTCKVFSYSSNNRYAADYYNACRKYDDIKYKLDNSKNLSPERTKELEKEFEYWDKQVPLTSNKAGAEENRLQTEAEKDKSRQGNTLDFMA